MEGREPVVRDSKGRLAKGSPALNPGGYTSREAKMMRDLRALGPRAIAKLGKLLDSPVESVALGAAKEILDRNLGKVRQNVTVDVTSTHVLHLEALQFLAQKKRDQLQATVIVHDATEDGIGLPDHSTLALSAADYSVSMDAGEPPRPADPAGAAAYAPTPPATLQKSKTPQDDTP